MDNYYDALDKLGGRRWPEGSLERLESCPVCGSPERLLLHEALCDATYFIAPGLWNFWQCAVCCSGYLDPRPDFSSIQIAYGNYYTHKSDDVKALYSDIGVIRRVRRKLVNGYLNKRFGSLAEPAWGWAGQFLKLIPFVRNRLDREYRHLPHHAASGGALLDLGSGNGEFLKLAQSCCWEAYGVDPDPDAVSASLRNQLWVELGGIDAAERLGKEFDVITMNHVLEHLHDPVDTLRRCHALLKPGGVLWLEFPNVQSQGHLRFGRHWRGLECPRHLVLPSLQAMCHLLDEIGFVDIQELARPSAIRPMFAAGRAMAAGKSPHKPSKATLSTFLADILWITLEKVGMCDKEFITLGCTVGHPVNNRK